MSIAHVKGEQTAYIKCEMTLDTSMEEAVAYQFLVTSRRLSKLENKDEILVQESIQLNNHSMDCHYVRDYGFGVHPRRWLNRHIWKRLSSNKMILAFDDVKKSKLLKENNRTKHISVLASNTGYYMFKAMKGDCASFGQTKVTFICQASLGKNIPQRIEDKRGARVLSHLIDTRELFNKDYEVDLARRCAIIGRFHATEASDGNKPTEDEDAEIARARRFFRKFERARKKKGKLIETDSEFIGAVGQVVDGSVWCKLSTTVRCGGVEALAFLLDVKSRSLLTKREIQKIILEVS